VRQSSTIGQVVVTVDWRSIPGNEHAFNRLRELVMGGEAIAFVGAGASAGLYPLWGGLIQQLADQAVSRGASVADREFWIKNSYTSPDVVVDGIKRAIDPGSFSELLREIFRAKAGSDGNRFTKVHGTLIRLPFKGYLTTNFDPGLVEARRQLRPDSIATGFGTWRDPDVVDRWQNGRIFRDQPCPLLFAHGIYERSETIVLGAAEYREAYRIGPFRRLFETIWKQQQLVFVGFSFSDSWIRTVANEGLFNGAAPSAPQHVAIIGIRQGDNYTPEMRRAVRDQYGAEAVFYPIAPASSGGEDHSALQSMLDELIHDLAPPPPPSPPLPPEPAVPSLRERWIHETTEDEHFTGRAEDMSRLDRWSADQDVRAIAVTGMGGLGKTSLVAHWVKTKASILPHTVKGVLFWSMYADRDVRGLFRAIVSFAVEELGAAVPQGRHDVVATALQILRGTSMLLVIDGLELLQDISSSSGGALLRDELRDLLDGMCRMKRGSVVLLTSRFPFADLTPYLGRGFRALHLDHLSSMEGAALLESCGVAGTQAEREVVTRQFNGHPLGLRLFALTLAQQGGGDLSRLIRTVFDAAELSDEVPLERKLKHLLEFYEKGMPRPQAALIGIVSFFRSLAPEQTILALARRLPAVSDATAGSTDAELRDALDTLVHQRLLLGDPDQRAWSCHPILRDHFRQSLLGWSPGIATGAAGILTARPAPDRPTDIQALEPVLAAVDLLLTGNDFVGADQLFRERLGDGSIFRQLAAPSEGMRCALGFVRDDERRGRCERVLSKNRLARYINQVAVSARDAGEFEFGLRYFAECTAMYRESGQKLDLITALQNWTGLLIILGRLSDAERHAREAVDVATEAEAAEVKGPLSYLGTIFGKRGRIGTALAAFDDATKVERRTNLEAMGLFGRRGIRFADLLLRIGSKDDARRLTDDNLRICVQNGWQEETAQCWTLLGEIAADGGLFAQAEGQFKAAEKIFRGGHVVSQIPRILLAQGDLERRRGRWEQADAAVEEALTLAAPRQMRLDHADALLLRARLELDQSGSSSQASARPEDAAHRATDSCDAALQIARECGYAWAERDALALLTRSHEILRSGRAIDFARQAKTLSDRLSDTRPPDS
jgi:tetratricopeptide (TPR) repeat protein